MSKKHYICTHTWNDSESRKLVIKQTKGMTDKMFFEALKSKKAEALQHWRGKDDFFFCHWYAETDDDIFAALEAAGFNDLMHTLPNEMQLFLSAETLTDKTTQEYLDQP